MNRKIYLELLKDLPVNPKIGDTVFASVVGNPKVTGFDVLRLVKGKTFGSGCATYDNLKWSFSPVQIYGVCQMRCKFTSSKGWQVTCDCVFNGAPSGVRRTAVCVSEILGTNIIGLR